MYITEVRIHDAADVDDVAYIIGLTVRLGASAAAHFHQLISL